MSDTPQPPKRKRRWFRYSLRTLLVVMTILCVVLAFWTHRAKRQKAVVKWVEENGGWVSYDNPHGPEWLQDSLGKDYLATVDLVVLGDDPVDGVVLGDNEVKNVAPLAKLGRLKYLFLESTKVSNLTPLSGLKNLELLVLDKTQVTDLTPLAGLTSLKMLHLDNTKVSDLTPLAQLKSLTKLEIANTQVSDLTPLMKLTSLENLDLDNTQVTQEQINVLQNALPNCYIQWSPADNATKGN